MQCCRVVILPPTIPIEIDKLDQGRAWVHHSVEEDSRGPRDAAMMKSHCCQDLRLKAQGNIAPDGG